MEKILVKNRISQEVFEEKVYGGTWLRALYPSAFILRILAFPFVQLIARLPFVSRMYGCCQERSASKKKIGPFIEAYQINMEEFEQPKGGFASFNDFFIRKLIPSSRRCEGDLIIPADGRYQVLTSISRDHIFHVKGLPMDLHKLTGSRELATRYEEGSLVIARLAPPDYHRFHFPCTGAVSKPWRLKGPLFSVNPTALKKRHKILFDNKRMLTEIDSPTYGKVLFVEVGATCVGTIHQTFYAKHQAQFDQMGKLTADIGEEKGYFSFGGSCILMLFEPGKVEFCKDLIISPSESPEYSEVLCAFGQKLGSSPNNS